MVRAAVILVLLGAASCGAPDHGASDGAPVDAAPRLAIFLVPERLAIKRTGAMYITLNVVGARSVARLTVDGLPDGVTADPAAILPNSSTAAIALHASADALLGDVRIVVEAAAESGELATSDGFLTVAERSGALDPGFGGTGVVTLDIDGDPATVETPVGLGVDHEGFVFVVGQIDDTRSFVVTLRPEGTLEPTSPGVLPIGVTATSGVLWDTVRKWTEVDASGNFVVRDLQSINDIELDLGGLDAAMGVAFDWQVTVAGTTTAAAGTHVAVARLDLDGSPASGFGVDGTMAFDYPGPMDRIVGVARDFGSNDLVLAQLGDSVGLARIDATGRLDPFFGGGGIAVVDAAPEPLVAIGLDHLGSSPLVSCARGAARALSLRVFGFDGTPDLLFGAAGVLEDQEVVDPGTAIPNVDGVLATGSRQDELIVTRYTYDGQRDLTFGDAGRVTLPIGQRARGVKLATQTDGRITVAGTSDGKLVLVRFFP